jgi:hypothetical protein
MGKDAAVSEPNAKRNIVSATTQGRHVGQIANARTARTGRKKTRLGIIRNKKGCSKLHYEFIYAFYLHPSMVHN